MGSDMFVAPCFDSYMGDLMIVETSLREAACEQIMWRILLEGFII